MKKLLTSLALACCATSATAEVHELQILRYGYFPERVYVQPGDTIRIVNKSPSWAKVASKDPSDNLSGYNPEDRCAINPSTNSYYFNGSRDGWYRSAWVPVDGHFDIVVDSCIETEIEAPEIYNLTRYDGYNEAYIVFGEAPIN